jgi:hypothetical protein
MFPLLPYTKDPPELEDEIEYVEDNKKYRH